MISAEQTPSVADHAPKGAASEITLWFRLGNAGYEFNHLEDGHSHAMKPAPKVPAQKTSWANGTWVKEYAWLDASTPPKVLHGDEAKVARILATAQ